MPLSSMSSLDDSAVGLAVLLDPAACLEPVPPIRVLGKIPKAARFQHRVKLTAILEEVVEENSTDAWKHLFQFPTQCLWVPVRSSGRENSSASLASKVKEQVNLEKALSLRGQGRMCENTHGGRMTLVWPSPTCIRQD